jgi:hypothetical protein
LSAPHQPYSAWGIGRPLAADLFGRVADWPAVILVALLAIDSHAGDGCRDLYQVNQKPYGCVPAPGRRSPLSQVPFGKENFP